MSLSPMPGGVIKAIGLVSAPYSEQSKPSEFGSAGDSWSDTGWGVLIEWKLLEKPIRPKDNLGLIAPLLPSKNSPLQANGNGNQSCYLAGISEALGNLVLSLAEGVNPSFADDIEQHQADLEGDAIEAVIKASTLETTEKLQLTKARIGQGLFRTQLEAIEPKCRVTGVTNKALLIASHIKPWSKCENNAERLDGNNGLLLSPHIDKLFDRGWITFSDAGDLLVPIPASSRPYSSGALSYQGMSAPSNPSKLSSSPIIVMKFSEPIPVSLASHPERSRFFFPTLPSPNSNPWDRWALPGPTRRCAVD